MTESPGTVSPDAVRKRGKHATILGVITMLLGIFAMATPLLVGMSVAWIVGILVFLGGVSRLIWAFKAETTGRGIFMFIVGVLTMLAGGAMLANPLFMAGVLTIVLAVYLVFDGIGEIIMAFEIKPLSGWGMVLFAGIVSLLLGIAIWRQFPLSGPWAIGLILGIKLFLAGLMMLMLGATAREVAKSVEE